MQKRTEHIVQCYTQLRKEEIEKTSSKKWNIIVEGFKRYKEEKDTETIVEGMQKALVEVSNEQ